jgi:hypothetical protein
MSMAGGATCRWRSDRQGSTIPREPAHTSHGRRHRGDLHVNDMALLPQVIIALAALVAPVVFLARFIARGEDSPLDAIAWPRGVQEEDPQPWRFAPTAG